MKGGEVMAEKAEKTILPIFRDYTIDYLHVELDRSVLYLARMMEGHETPGPKFKRMAARTLGKTVQELFGDDPTTER